MEGKFTGRPRSCLPTRGAPPPAADALNELLCAAGIDERFITLSLSLLDLQAHELTVCSAGHLPLLIRRADGRVEEVGAEIIGYPLGIMDDSIYEQTQVK